MKKKFLLFLLTPLFLSSCIRNNGLCYDHVDKDQDGICDVCNYKIGDGHDHIDDSGDGLCDICGYQMPIPPGPIQPCDKHVDADLDAKCDVCGADLSIPEHTHIDNNSDHLCDLCGAAMEECTNHQDFNNDGKCDYCGYVMPLPTGEVTTYLVLSSVGLYKGNEGISVTEKNLENTIVFIAKPGDPLPTKEDVTHIYGSAELKNWYCYEGKGAPTEYTTVPSENGKILYANFVSNGQNPVDPTPGPGPNPPTPPTPGETETYYLLTNFTDGSGNWNVSSPKFYAYVFKDANSRAYLMNQDNESKYSVDIPTNTYDYIIFVRCNSSATTFDWSYKWNQTQDLAFENGKHTAQIVNWDGGAKGESVATWVA